MHSRGYSELDHKADLALRVWGETFFALLTQSALGMYDLMGVVADEKVRIDHQFLIEISTPEMMLVDFLGELLYQAEDLKLAYSGFDFALNEEELKIWADGHPIQEVESTLKAVTYHDLEIMETDSGLETIITFDV
jgi:SHS2 domain-containing protein